MYIRPPFCLSVCLSVCFFVGQFSVGIRNHVGEEKTCPSVCLSLDPPSANVIPPLFPLLSQFAQLSLDL